MTDKLVGYLESAPDEVIYELFYELMDMDSLEWNNKNWFEEEFKEMCELFIKNVDLAWFNQKPGRLEAFFKYCYERMSAHVNE